MRKVEQKAQAERCMHLLPKVGVGIKWWKTSLVHCTKGAGNEPFHVLAKHCETF